MDRLKYWWRAWRPELITGFAYLVFRLIAMTVRMKVVGWEPGGTSDILCGWHGRSFIFANHFRNRGFWVIISQSRDGEMQARVFRRLGYKIIRGSTGRGGVRALVEAIRALKAGGVMAMTPDGPRGPSQVCQPGVIAMAQKSGARLIPMGVTATPRKLLKSWDRYLLPAPFARGLIVAGEGFTVPPDADEATLEEARLRLEREMTELQAEAERRLGIT